MASPAAGEVELGHPAVEHEGDTDEDALQSIDEGEDVTQTDHLIRQSRHTTPLDFSLRSASGSFPYV